MIFFQTIAVAFAMFSAVPVPQFEWNEKNMRYAMCAFPLIGLVIGGLWSLCGALPLPALVKAAVDCWANMNPPQLDIAEDEAVRAVFGYLCGDH